MVPTITVTRLHRPQAAGAILAFASVDVGGMLVIHGCKLIKGKNEGTFLAMPSKKSEKDGKFYDDVTLLNRDLKDAIHQAVEAKYQHDAAPPSAAEEPDADTF